VTAPDPDFVGDVREGLTDDPKHLPPKWLYDDRGSKLFEQITQLDEYYLTDRERAIFAAHADDIVDRCAEETGLVELGAGSAEKTRLIVDALVDRQGSALYCPIDISQQALEMAHRRFEDDENVTVRGVQGEFVEGLTELDATDGPRLIAFIGSSIGNMELEDQRDLLRAIADAMRPEDRFLLGTDMRKDPSILRPAYDDSEGVTARFTLNLLRRLNRELGADFDLDAFEHEVRFNPEKSAIESFLVSQRDQDVHIDALDLTVHFDEREATHVENSFKYTDEMLDDLSATARLDRETSWFDADEWFGVHLFRKES
jgi:L-histidine N-alpha-methyltransferase